MFRFELDSHQLYLPTGTRLEAPLQVDINVSGACCCCLPQLFPFTALKLTSVQFALDWGGKHGAKTSLCSERMAKGVFYMHIQPEAQ